MKSGIDIIYIWISEFLTSKTHPNKPQLLQEQVKKKQASFLSLKIHKLYAQATDNSVVTNKQTSPTPKMVMPLSDLAELEELLPTNSPELGTGVIAFE